MAIAKHTNTSARVDLKLSDLLIATVVVGFFNAQFIRISRQIAQEGVFDQIYATFGINLVVWCALFAILAILIKVENTPATQRDLAILFVGVLFFLSPVTAFSAIGLSGIGAYYAIWGKSHDLRRAMRLLFALTVTLMWGRFAFSFLLPYILKADTALVTLFTGLRSFSNIIVASDNNTLLQVGAGCSSFLNLTTAVLGWIGAILYFDVRVTARRVGYLIASCLVIIVINTFRIGLIGWMPEHYELIHGTFGFNVANLIQSGSILYLSHSAAASR